MYLQTVMLLIRAEGLHSCPQMAWSQVRETVADVLSPPEGLILFCGMSIRYEDPTVSYVRTGSTRSTRRSRSSTTRYSLPARSPHDRRSASATNAPRATDRPGDASLSLSGCARRAHWRAAAVMSEALPPLGIEFRHFAVLLVLVNRGPRQRTVEATSSTRRGSCGSWITSSAKGSPCASPFREIGACGRWRSPPRGLSFSTPLTWPRSHWLSVWYPEWGRARRNNSRICSPDSPLLPRRRAPRGDDGRGF